MRLKLGKKKRTTLKVLTFNKATNLESWKTWSRKFEWSLFWRQSFKNWISSRESKIGVKAVRQEKNTIISLTPQMSLNDMFLE